LVKTLFWLAAGETPPSSSTARSGVKQLREVDGIGFDVLECVGATGE